MKRLLAAGAFMLAGLVPVFIAPALAQQANDPQNTIFLDTKDGRITIRLRPDLAPRDRSLVTVSALIASGQVAQIPYHLNRAMDNGLTREQAGEVLTHLAFYVGWPNGPSR